MKEKNWKLINFCEFDRFAEISYCAIHKVDKSLNLGDIVKVDSKKLKGFNFMTWGFPCTDISLSGKQKGFIDENGKLTRSGMYYEGIRVLRDVKPSVSIIENVKALVGSKFKNEFAMILSDLEEAGYNSYHTILNAKDFGVPQNRERVFIVSILKELDNGQFKFPTKKTELVPLESFMEDKVDTKYYISNDAVSRFITDLNSKESLVYDSIQVKRELKSREYNEYSPTLSARDYKDPKLVNAKIIEKLPEFKLRKMTTKEYFRLMGFGDELYQRAKDSGVSDSQLYKQAGNSIVVDVLYWIFVELYKAMPYLFDDLTLGSFFSGIGAPEVALNRLYEAINTGNFTHP